MNPTWKNSALLRCAKQAVLRLDVDLLESVAAGPSGAGVKNCSTLQASPRGIAGDAFGTGRKKRRHGPMTSEVRTCTSCAHRLTMR